MRARHTSPKLGLKGKARLLSVARVLGESARQHLAAQKARALGTGMTDERGAMVLSSVLKSGMPWLVEKHVQNVLGSEDVETFEVEVAMGE